MSTNINPQELPDAASLEQLANQLFAALPGTSFLNELSLPNTSEIALPQDWGSKQSTPPFPATANPPASVAGSGVAPSAIAQSKEFNLEAPPTSLPDPHFAGKGQIPKSVAGSGVSPATTSHTSGYEGYNTYLRPAHASTLPTYPFQSTTLQPSVLADLPYLSDQSTPTELSALLSTISLAQPSAQLPVPANTSLVQEASFYFLSENKRPTVAPTTQKPSQIYLQEKSKIARPPFDANLLKRDFPILQEQVNGRPLIWLDNAATTQKPRQVIDRIRHFYEHENSNIHRAAHELAARATDAYEEARQKVKQFLNAGSANEIVFVRGATEAINLVAKSWGAQNLSTGDEIIVSHLEHHANIVPWQQLAAKKGLKIRVIPVDEDGQLILEEYARLLNPRTKLVSVTQVSNALGTVTPARQIVDMAHRAGARVLIDGAQAVSHMRADVQALDCDWYVFSGHKVFGPTGIGVLYGKEDLLNQTQPWQGGGNMIVDVTFEHTQYHPAPGRFEAGTGNIADAVGLGAAIDYVTKIGIDLIHQYEHYLLHYATGLLREVPGLRIVGTAPDKAGVVSFVLEGFRTEEVGAALNRYGIAVRSGHHCAQPILRRFGLESTVRPSLALYNTCEDIDALVAAIYQIRQTRK